MAFNILNHSAVPKHEILSEDEIQEIFANVDYSISDLPKITVNDPVSIAIGAKEGQVLKITRKSELVSGENNQKWFYKFKLFKGKYFFWEF